MRCHHDRIICRRVVRAGRDLIEDALELLADEDVRFRGSLPPRFLDQPIDARYVADLGRRLADALADGKLAERAWVG